MKNPDDILENQIAKNVLHVAFDVHSQLGPGLLENAYKQALYYKLKKAGLHVEMEKPMPLKIDGVDLEVGYRIDMLVENKVVLELKAIEVIQDIHIAQTLNYLKLGGFKLGLILNFNQVRLKYGIKRVVNGLEE